MRIITDREISGTTGKIYNSWFKISNNLSILDIMVLNKIGSYYDREFKCGVKEIEAELSVSKSRISKSLWKWVKLGFLTEFNCKCDRRRRFFRPTKLMVESRNVAFKDIRDMHEELRKDI